MSFIDAIKTCLKDKYCCFTGRARRSEFWFFTLFTCIVMAIVTGITSLIGNQVVTSVLELIFGLALLLPSLGVEIRRLHDIGKPWGYIFFHFIPVVGSIILFVWSLKAGVVGANEYGPDPKNA